MKSIPVILLALMALPAYSQNLLEALEAHQASLPTPEGTTSDRPPVGITAPSSRPTDNDTSCSDDTQKSLPLKYLTGLILERDAKLELNPEPSSGSLTISSPGKMIGNCNSMLDWHLRENEIDGVKTYAVEVKFKEGGECSAEVAAAEGEKCFRVAKMKSGSFEKFESLPFKNDIQGFQRCLEQSGVVGADGKIKTEAIYKQPVHQRFSGVEETGKILFLSEGPVSSQIDPRFAVDRVNKCEVYEKIHPTISMVYSAHDLRNQRLNEQADALRECRPEEYHRLVDFIERNNYVGDLNAIRDNLILQAAQATAKKIAENKDLNDEDMKVIADFERYIVEPKRTEIAELFSQLESAPDSQKDAIRQQLNQKRLELEAYAKSPYFQKSHVEKLLAKGMFADAEKMEGIRIGISEFSKVGKKEGNVTVTPQIALVRIVNAKNTLAETLITERENYDIRTGVTTGTSDSFRDLALALQRNIQTRTQNYTREIQSEYARVQQGGYCYQYYRNTQKCIQDSLQRIQELQNALTHYNNLDNERITEYGTRMREYQQLEAEGRTYRARQNGEAAPTETPRDTTAVPERVETQEVQVSALAQQQAMMLAQMQQMQGQGGMMMQQQQNPYGSMYGQQSSWMGQAGFNAGFGFQGATNTGMFGMQQQGGFGSSGINWYQIGQQMMGGQQQQMMSPYGNMYNQNPYLQMQGMGQFGYMPQAYTYPSFF